MNHIPHTIHYCWFGNNPLDQKAIDCIASWRKFFPDYEIIQWNEDNFDINQYDFTRQAYEDKKWAFVSDVARLHILYEHGGLYFDTDVEVIAPYTDILNTDCSGFMGFEKTMQVATGLGFGAVQGCPLLKELLDIYRHVDYKQYADNLSEIACTVLTTDLLTKRGLTISDIKQTVCGIDIYPTEYFSPRDYYTGVVSLTPRTHSVHWYTASWQSIDERANFEKMQRLYRVIGRKAADTLLGIYHCMKNEGVCQYIWKRICKYLLRK